MNDPIYDEQDAALVDLADRLHASKAEADRQRTRAEAAEAELNKERLEVIGAIARKEAAQRDAANQRAEVERLTARLRDASTMLNELVAPDPSKELAQRIHYEFADFKMVVDHCSEVYDHFSRGRISKPNTLPREVITLADDFATQDVKEAVAEETQELREGLAAVTARLRDVEAERDKLRVSFRATGNGTIPLDIGTILSELAYRRGATTSRSGWALLNDVRNRQRDETEAFNHLAEHAQSADDLGLNLSRAQDRLAALTLAAQRLVEKLSETKWIYMLQQSLGWVWFEAELAALRAELGKEP